MKRPSNSDSSSEKPLAGLRFSLVGPGRVGGSLLSWAQACGATVNKIAGRPQSPSARQLGLRFKASWCDVQDLTSVDDDLLLIAVSDPQIGNVVDTLATQPQARTVLHTAGSLDASVLAPLNAAGSAVGSLHPLKSFPRILPDVETAKGSAFAIDGDPEALHLARRLVTVWQGEAMELAGTSRTLYHLAATLAAGGVATIMAMVEEISAGIALPPQASHGFLDLARGTLEQIEDLGDPKAAITGPIARGDRETQDRHTKALSKDYPQLSPLVRMLGDQTSRQWNRQDS